jgi:hypothetical protein
MEDPENQEAFAIQAKALERAGIPKAYAEMISRAGGTGGLQKFVLREANGLWNDPKILGQAWHGIRLWFLIKFLLFGVSVVRILPALLLIMFLIGIGALGVLAVAFASRNTADISTAPPANWPDKQAAPVVASPTPLVYIHNDAEYLEFQKHYPVGTPFLWLDSITNKVEKFVSGPQASATPAATPDRVDLSAVSDVQVGTKLAYINDGTITGEVTAKSLDFVTVKWQYDRKVISYSYEQLAQQLKSGRIVIN